jgi:acyl-CoA thioester hydrolase
MDELDQPYTGRIIGNGAAAEHRFAQRVYFEDTDFSGIVYHARYLHFCERARSDFMARLGLDQRAVHDAGEGAFAVTRMDCRFLAPARFDDALVVVSRILKSGGASFTLNQSIRRESSPIFEAEVRAAFLSPDGRPKKLPKAWTVAIAAL